MNHSELIEVKTSSPMKLLFWGSSFCSSVYAWCIVGCGFSQPCGSLILKGPPQALCFVPMEKTGKTIWGSDRRFPSLVLA